MFSMAIALLLFLRTARFDRYRLLASFEAPDRATIKSMFTLSFPIYLSLGKVESASHNIAIGIASLTFMLPLGLSFALTARVGRVYGRTSLPAIKQRITAGLVVTAILAMLMAILLVLFRFELAALYTDDEKLIAFAAHLLLFGAAFQLSDGAQIAFLAVLRGLQDFRVPMFINAFSYWGVAFSLGFYAAHYRGYGAQGLWVGLIVGLSLAAVLLALRLRWKLRDIARNGFAVS